MEGDSGKKLKPLVGVVCLLTSVLALLCVCTFSLQLFLSSAPRYSAGLSDSPWEAKAIAVIQTIKDEEVIAIINQPINQSVNRSINQSINIVSVDQSSINQPINLIN